MAAGALSIRIDISFCPAGKAARCSQASPETLTAAQTHAVLAAVPFPLGDHWCGEQSGNCTPQGGCVRTFDCGVQCQCRVKGGRVLQD